MKGAAGALLWVHDAAQGPGRTCRGVPADDEWGLPGLSRALQAQNQCKHMPREQQPGRDWGIGAASVTAGVWLEMKVRKGRKVTDARSAPAHTCSPDRESSQWSASTAGPVQRGSHTDSDLCQVSSCWLHLFSPDHCSSGPPPPTPSDHTLRKGITRLTCLPPSASLRGSCCRTSETALPRQPHIPTRSLPSEILPMQVPLLLLL